jgi:hypothetical protein
MAWASRHPTFRNLNTFAHTGRDSRTGAASVTCRVGAVPAYKRVGARQPGRRCSRGYDLAEMFGIEMASTTPPNRAAARHEAVDTGEPTSRVGTHEGVLGCTKSLWGTSGRLPNRCNGCRCNGGSLAAGCSRRTRRTSPISPVFQTAAHRRTDLSGGPAADRRHELTNSGNCLAELVLRSGTLSNTCGRLQRFEQPPPSGNRFDGLSAAVLNEALRAGRDNFGDRNGDNRFRVTQGTPHT